MNRPELAATLAHPTAPPASSAADAPEAAARPEPIPFVQVGFAGHNRAADLGAPDDVLDGLRCVFRRFLDAGVVSGRLLTGAAEGADLLAIEAWRETGLGPIHAIHPFLEARAAEEEPWDAATWLDGEATLAAGRNPHLAQARWVVGAADVLVVVWTGRHARGAGGTADAVRLALEHGIPVIWIRPGHPDAPCLIRPEHLDEDFGFLEFVEELRLGRAPLVTPATTQAVRAALCDLGLAAAAAPAAELMRPTATGGLAWPWRIHALFRRAVGGPSVGSDPIPPPADLVAQPGFAALSRAHVVADAEAERLGAIHRSHQIMLLATAILAAAAGSSAAFWPHLKLLMVAIELLFALGALLVWLDAERGERHHRWGAIRRLAEDLRIERAAWALGLSTMPHGVSAATGAEARGARRLAGLPVGAFDARRVERWGRWAVEDLIRGQADYHHRQADVNGRISHRVHLAENAAFAGLLVVLIAYFLVGFINMMRGAETPHWFGALVFMAGAVVPAIGAAGLALEATLSIGEQGRRSRRLAEELDHLSAAVEPAARLERLQGLARAAIRLQRAQEEFWTQETGRRRLFRGG